MSYCSLEEAWGEKFANLYSRNDSMLVNMPEEKDTSSDKLLEDRTLTQKSSPIKDRTMAQQVTPLVQENFQNNDYECKKFYQHFIECDKCREKIDKILSKNRKEDITESFSLDLRKSNNPVLITILLGIFIIFIIDLLRKIK